ncbi:unnamed protein product [Orchesella dallaii]|uniref:Vitelline membrane outer layer protein 1 n=1 Tax=Orchesella dallaii TaxID=48710 RepID=A0ABP1QDQ1_9HEXA
MNIINLLPCMLALLVSSSARRSNNKPSSYQGDEILVESPAVTNWGDWGKLQTCRTGFLVTGFQLKVEVQAENNDNTALNSVRFICGVPFREQYKEMELITSSYGPWGSTGEKIFCGGYAVGFQLKSQNQQGKDDDVAAINLKMICENGTVHEGYDESEDFYLESVYTETMRCPEKHAVCGLQTQVESRQLLGDDTSLNNIRIKCCPVLNLYRTTTTELATEEPTSAPVTDRPASVVFPDNTSTTTPEVEEIPTVVPEEPVTEEVTTAAPEELVPEP